MFLNNIVSFQVAKKLKQLGFEGKDCMYSYQIGREKIETIYTLLPQTNNGEIIPAPDVVTTYTWLWNKGIVKICIDFERNNYTKLIVKNKEGNIIYTILVLDLEKGLKDCIENLNELNLI